MMAPKLNKKLILENPVEKADGQGGFTISWVPLGHIWAAVDYGGPSLDDAPGGQRVKKRVQITVRMSPLGAQSRPRPEQRFRAEDAVFDILAVDAAQRTPGYLICHCQSEALT